MCPQPPMGRVGCSSGVISPPPPAAPGFAAMATEPHPNTSTSPSINIFCMALPCPGRTLAPWDAVNAVWRYVWQSAGPARHWLSSCNGGWRRGQERINRCANPPRIPEHVRVRAARQGAPGHMNRARACQGTWPARQIIWGSRRVSPHLRPARLRATLSCSPPTGGLRIETPSAAAIPRGGTRCSPPTGGLRIETGGPGPRTHRNPRLQPAYGWAED